ncbi:hypothetical protein D3C72_2424440 [compost metagenome]
MMRASNEKNSQSGRKPLRAKASQTPLKAVKLSTAPCDSRRMPSRRTMRELVKDDTAISPAMAAKATGK